MILPAILMHNEMKQREFELERLIKEKTKALQKAPEGNLHTKSKQGNIQYYRQTEGKLCYLKKKELSLARGLAQKSYDIKILKLAGEELKAIQRFQKSIRPERLEKLFEELPEGKRCLVTPAAETAEIYGRKWQEEDYMTKGFREDDRTSFYSFRGERMRSKSEVLLANLFAAGGIPYRYEEELILPDGLVIYPDFRVMNVRTGEILIWEHLGMMDDMEYVQNALKRLEKYERSGYYAGRDLLISFETSESPLDIRMAEKKMEEFLL